MATNADGASGGYRARRSSRAMRMAFMLASPLILPVLLSRMIRRVLSRDRALLRPLLAALPWLLALLASWSAGEPWGSIVGDRTER